jgi:hypothetical protein
MNTPLAPDDVCRVLQPLFDLGDARDLNGPTQRRLAEMILPHTAADLTVREVLDLLEQTRAEDKAAQVKAGAA